ncbi:DUF5979 domain-containing protein, partial [Paenibacillus filicis]
MKRKRSVSKSVLSFCLAVMLILQTVMFSALAYAESAPAVSEPGSSDANGPSVPEAVYNVPDGHAVLVGKPAAITVGPADKTAVLMGANSPFPLTVQQGTPAVVIPPGGTIQGRQPFTLKSEGLKVPVNGDDADPTNADPSLYIQKGDWIELKSADHFQEAVLPTATKPLMAQTESGSKKLGTAYFTPVSIKVLFDGDEGFFNGVGRAVTFGFETTANSDLSGMDYGDTKPISMFGKTYQLKNPDVTAAYSITLTSPGMIKWDQYSYRGLQATQLVEGAVTWQSTVSAFDKLDNTIKLSLDGKTFYTNPSSYNTGNGNVRGIYVSGSFKVNGIEATPSIGGDGSLTYTFPAETGVDPKVEYKTWIPKEGYYYEHRNPPSNLGRSYRDMFGKVELRQGNDKLAEAGQEISFAPDWIQASASYDHANEMITWKVVVNNYNKKGLKDFTITNVLPNGLEFTSATRQTWVDNAASAVTSIIPDANGVYSFGNIDGKVELVIKSKVTNGSNFRIDPRANWNLDTPGGIQNNDIATGTRPTAVTDEAIVTIGDHTFTKFASIAMEDFHLGGVTWTVSLAPQYTLPNAVVYDVLVHGGDLSVLDQAVDATGEVSKEAIAKIKANVNTAQLWTQYHAGTLKSANGLTMKAIPLTVNGEVVADLIKVTGYTDQSASFSFRALVTNPDILFRQDINTGKTLWNRALLFEGETVKQAQKDVNLHLRMLNKDMLFASKPLKADGTPENVTPNNASSYISDDNNEAWTISAYDRTTKTVTFRLGVNMPGYNTVEMAKDGGSRVITNVKLVDTLPVDWEFVPFTEGKNFELWKGYSDNGSGTSYGVRNNAVSIIEPNDPAHVVNFSHSGNVGTFTFSKLEGPYVILVKARPSNAALEKYLDEYTAQGKNKQVLYNKADLHMTWGGVEKVLTEQRKLIVPIQALGKSVTKPFPGVLEWTVNYYPPYHMENGVYLEDTLGAGMNLRKDESGKLVLIAPSMAVYRAKLTASGALERDGAALNLSDPNSEIRVEAEPGAGGTTVLKFMMTNPNNYYQFVYQSEVDPTKAKAGDKMGNEVKLVGDDKLKLLRVKSESTLDSTDVSGSSGSNALLPLKKVDPSGNPLKGVEFTLYKKDGGTQVAKGTTGGDGKLNLLFPNPGFYELKETYIDTTTWLPTTRIYQVYVGNTPGKPIWVDGVKVTAGDPLVVPTPAAGKLTISNKVAGNGSDKNKEFAFTITFQGEGKGESYPYTKPDGTSGTIKSGDTIQLKHGQSAVIPNLLEGLVYSVTGNDYSPGGYSTDPTNRILTDTIVANGDHKAPFVHTRMVYGSLQIGQTVTGNGGQPDKAFEFTVTFGGEGASGEYAYTKPDGTTGRIKSGGKIALKHGETVTMDRIPKDTTYTVTETDYTTDGYTTEPTSLTHTGTIAEGGTHKALFVNTRMVYGSLTIGQKVAGNGGQPDKVFEFTVTFDGEGKDASYAYTGTGVASGSLKSGDTIRLKHGEQIKFPKLPKGLTYTVVETDYTSDGYTTNWPDRTHTDTISEGGVHQAEFVNTRLLFGGLLIGQTVEGGGADKDKAFVFTVTFGGAGASEEYTYTKSDGTTGKMKSGDTISLKHGKTVAIAETDILTGTTYKVTETDYTAEGYTTNPAGLTHSGTIVEKQISEARFVNTKYLPGKLLIGQKVMGNGGQPDKAFEFTVTFGGEGASGEYAYTKPDGTAGTIKSGGTITLKHGETVAIAGIPKDTTYTVTETDYATDGYTTDPTGLAHTGTIAEGGTHKALFVNTRMVYGSLTIGQKVAGNGGQPDKAFEFTVTFDGEGKDASYAYTGTGAPSGSLKSGDTIHLKHGEQIKFPKLPKGLTYTVIETDYTADGYTTNWPDRTHTDTISEDGVHQAEFVNTRLLFGGLLIGQTVEGSGADKDKAFVFTVTFDGTGANEEYAYTKSDGTTGKMKSGGTISLKHGETVAIAETDILTGTTYTVTETDYSVEGYTTNPVGLTHSGTIVEKQISEARFVNAKYLPGKLTLTADPAAVPGDGKTPSQLTATLTDYAGNPVVNREVVFTLPDQSEVKATTDEQGRAVISYTPPKLGATTPEDHIITAKVNSLTEGILTATANVTAMPAAIVGVLRDNTTGEVIPNATIVITNDTNGEKHTITTDAAGAYFLPVAYGGDYTISFPKKIKINGVDESITFTQKAVVDSNVKGGEVVPAHITAVGIVLVKQPEGHSSLMKSALANKMRIYLRDANGNYMVDQNGAPKAFSLQPDGSFFVDGLAAESYKMEVRYEVARGKELTLIRDAKLDVKANGELNISQELVDPYGIITDAKTGAAIAGARVTLYYADTPRNRANGIVPGTTVTLPAIPGFEPNDNASPSQNSDATGSYAYMVFPDTDYYLIVTKAGYETHVSATISVGIDIVRYDVQLKPLSSDGSEPGNGSPEPGNGNPGAGNGNPGAGNGNPGAGNGNPGAGNGNPGAGNGNPGTGNANPGTGNSNPGAGNGNPGAGNG